MFRCHLWLHVAHRPGTSNGHYCYPALLFTINGILNYRFHYSEEGFRQLFENAADNLILHDRGRVIEVQPADLPLPGVHQGRPFADVCV